VLEKIPGDLDGADLQGGSAIESHIFPFFWPQRAQRTPSGGTAIKKFNWTQMNTDKHR
jgi:hypothetical protein